MKRKFSFKKFFRFIFILIILDFLIFFLLYEYNISSVGGNKKVNFVIDKGMTFYSISSSLKDKKLIHSENFYKLYLKMNKPHDLTPGTYELNTNMDVPKIVKYLSNKNNIKDTSIRLTFREGLNAKQMSEIVAKKTNITSEEFLNKINDSNYINSLKTKYWFITDDVLNNNLKYKLEGYLYPDTYVFDDKKSVSLDKLINMMLDNTGKKLSSLNIKNNIHQTLTLASIIELEANSKEDRFLVSGVFHNRLNNKWPLGSDVTTYYSANKTMGQTLTQNELNACDGYNTRCKTMNGLPIGPIDNPSITSIEASINPASTNYYYFVADTDGKIYYSVNYNDHNKIINDLKKAGKWTS